MYIKWFIWQADPNQLQSGFRDYLYESYTLSHKTSQSSFCILMLKRMMATFFLSCTVARHLMDRQVLESQGHAGADDLIETRLFLGRGSPLGMCSIGSQHHIPK